MAGSTAGTRLAGKKTERGVTRVAAAILAVMALVSIVLAWNAPERAAAIGLMAFMVFLSSVAVGALLGFVFGLPRARATDLGGTGADTAGAPKGLRFLVNSNLIKVSDWLTTIVVGLTLVNIGDVVPALNRLATAVAPPLGGSQYAGAIGLPIMIGGVLAGFILCYLWTSIRLRELFEQAEATPETVPGLLACTVGEAEKVLGATTLKLVVLDDGGDAAPIAGQCPEPAARVPEGMVVAVTTKVRVPRLIGRTVPEAEGDLKEIGSTLDAGNADRDRPVATQDPAAGSWVRRGVRVSITT